MINGNAPPYMLFELLNRPVGICALNAFFTWQIIGVKRRQKCTKCLAKFCRQRRCPLTGGLPCSLFEPYDDMQALVRILTLGERLERSAQHGKRFLIRRKDNNVMHSFPG